MYSFDIFDTLITRATATPRGIFAIMQERLIHEEQYSELPEIVCQNFYQLRFHAEELANANLRSVGIEETTLNEIYEAMALQTSLTNADIKMLIELEIKTEIENTIPIMENIKKVEELLKRGEKVVLISDMYLPGNAIQDILFKVSPMLSKLPLYVSSEYCKTKRNGTLYEWVRSQEQVDFTDWIHCGNDVNTDYKVPNDLGISCEFFLFEELLPIERNEISKCEENAGIQYIIGASRNTRLLHHASGMGKYGAALGGPFFYAYVSWILEESQRRNYERLYFIARDGFLLKKIADIIIERRGLAIKTFYIYGSRRVWRNGAIGSTKIRLKDIAHWSYISQEETIEDVAAIFRLSPEEFCNAFQIVYEPGMAITEELRSYIDSYLVNEEDKIKTILAEHQKKSGMLAAQYINQEIDTSDNRFAFVELAGSGLTQECLAEIMNVTAKNPVPTFYFKLDKIRHLDNVMFHVYLPSHFYLHETIEMLCRAPHGQTSNYCLQGDMVVPVLDTYEDAALIEHGVNEYINGACNYVNCFLDGIDSLKRNPHQFRLFSDYFEYITRNPDEELMDYIAGMPNPVTGREQEVIEFAPELSRERLGEILKGQRKYKGTAFDYSLMRSDSASKEYYNAFYSLGGEVRDYIINYPYNRLKKRIVLYGAGLIGRELKKQIEVCKMSDIVLWVDKNVRTLSVQSPKTIQTVEYDQIVIAVLRSQKAEEIRENLVQMGISMHNVVWMNPDSVTDYE